MTFGCCGQCEVAAVVVFLLTRLFLDVVVL